MEQSGSCRLIVMGVGGVGKSAITNRFVRGRWIAKYDPTIEETYQKPVEVEGQVLQVEILDTAGQDAYSSLRETFMDTGDGFMLVYSITDDQTLEDLTDIREQISRVHGDPNVPIILVGNKIDMANESRAVTEMEGQQLASSWGAQFVEVSAKTDTNVSSAFERLLHTVVNHGRKASSNSKSNVFGSRGEDKSGEGYDYEAHSKEVGVQMKKKGLFSKCSIL